MTLILDMPFTDYLELDGWNWSKIKLLRDQSPKHVQYAMTAPDSDTSSRVWLRAVHCLVLEPHHFDRDFTSYDGRRDARTKAYKEFLRDAGGKGVLTPKEEKSARATAEAILSNPLAAKLLEHGRPEVTGQYVDPETGLLCKLRIDWLATDEYGTPYAIVDLKTIGSAHPKEVARLVAKYGYHGQMAHYQTGCSVLGYGELDVYIIAAEGKGAQDVGVYDLGAGVSFGALWSGKRLRSLLMAKLEWCVENDRWPGAAEFYSWPNMDSTPIDLDLPMWASEMDGE